MKAEDIKLGQIVYLADFNHRGIFAAKVTDIHFAEGEKVKDTILVTIRRSWKSTFEKATLNFHIGDDIDEWVGKNGYHEGLDYNMISFDFKSLKDEALPYIREFIERDIQDSKVFLEGQEQMTEQTAKDILNSIY